MKSRIVQLSVFHTGKLFALIGGFVSVILLPFFLIFLIINLAMAGSIFYMIILYPVMGFIGGIVMAAFYNLATKYVGGLEITVETFEPDNHID